MYLMLRPDSDTLRLRQTATAGSRWKGSGAWTRTKRTGSKARWVANYPTPDGAASKIDGATPPRYRVRRRPSCACRRKREIFAGRSWLLRRGGVGLSTGHDRVGPSLDPPVEVRAL